MKKGGEKSPQPPSDIEYIGKEEKGFGICVVDEGVADLIRQRRGHELETKRRNGLSVEAVEELRAFRNKHSELFDDIKSLSPITRQIAEFVEAMIDECEGKEKKSI